MAGIENGGDVRGGEVWQVVDERLSEVRVLPRAELDRRAAEPPETDVIARPSGRYRRITRVTALPHERFGLTVVVDAEGRRPRAEGRLIVTPGGAIAPEWATSGQPRENPFVFGPKVKAAGIVVAALLMALFFLMT